MRQRVEIQRLPDGYALKNGRRLLNFSDNDYLGLSFYPQVIQAAQEALTTYGAGAGASRLVTGNHPLYTQLEQELAQYKGTEDALVFGSGFLANLGVINGLIPQEDVILADRLIHASLVDAIKLSGVKFQRYRHNDMQHLRQLLEKSARCCWIITESVFSMDGDLAPLAEIQALAEEFGAMIIVDDAHGFGVLNPFTSPLASRVREREVSETPSPEIALRQFRPLPEGEVRRIIWTGTFSKAAGSYGGYVCTTKAQIEQMVNKARSLIYTTGLPPSVVAANLAALRIIRVQPELTALPLHHARLFDPQAQSAIVPVIIGTEEAALAAAKMLEEAGFLVPAIRPPTVPAGTSRLRFTFSAVHRAEDIARLRAIVKEVTS